MSFDMSTAQEVPTSETLNPSSKPKFDMASAVDISSQPPDNWQNVLHQASRSVMESNRQAQAGASEFLRNPMGGADSYMKGFSNPQGSETFANQFIRQDMEKNPSMMEDKNTIPAFFQTLPSNLLGSQVDMMANPLQAASSAAIGKYAEPVMQGIGKGASAVGQGIADSPVGKFFGRVSEAPIGNSGQMSMYNDINSTVKSAMPQAIHEMGGELNDLEAMGRGPIDVGSVVATASQDSKVAAMLKEFPEIAGAGKVTLPESQDFINSLKEPLPDRAWTSGAKPDERLMKNLASDIQDAQYSVHPEKEMIDAKYGVTANANKSIPKTRAGDVSPRIFTGARDPIVRGVQDENLKTLTGKDAFQQVLDYRKIQATKKLVGGVGKLGVAAKIFGIH